MKFRAAHHALLCYTEWCCDTQRPWPGLKRVAADMARNISDLHVALNELQRWGLVSLRRDGYGYHAVVRLGDGRETASNNRRIYPQETDVIRLIHKRTIVGSSGIIASNDARFAA